MLHVGCGGTPLVHSECLFLVVYPFPSPPSICSTSTLGSVFETESDSDQEEPGPRAGSQTPAAKSGTQVVQLTPVLPFKDESEEEDR